MFEYLEMRGKIRGEQETAPASLEEEGRAEEVHAPGPQEGDKGQPGVRVEYERAGLRRVREGGAVCREPQSLSFQYGKAV